MNPALCVNTCVELNHRCLYCVFFCILLRWGVPTIVIYFSFSVHEFLSGCVPMSTGVAGEARRGFGSLELEVQGTGCGGNWILDC